MKREGRTALYRLYAGRRLMYVGISHNPDARWGQHSLTKEWWPEVTRRKVEWFNTRAEAADAEREAIKNEKPRWNDRHQDATPPRKPIDVPTDRLELYGRHKRHLEGAAELKDPVREQAAKDLLAGATPAQLAKLSGLSDEFFRRIARAVGAERKREPTVGREAKPKTAAAEPSPTD